MGAIVRPMLSADVASAAEIIATIKVQEFSAEMTIESLINSTVLKLKESMEQSKAGFFVVEQGSRILGCAGIVQDKTLPSSYCVLESLFVKADMRGSGLGLRLINACLEFARKSGFQHCYLETLKDMTAAQKLYIKCGFIPLKKSMRADVPSYIECFMTKNLE
jgi:putative acetyltransferase